MEKKIKLEVLQKTIKLIIKLDPKDKSDAIKIWLHLQKLLKELRDISGKKYIPLDCAIKRFHKKNCDASVKNS